MFETIFGDTNLLPKQTLYQWLVQLQTKWCSIPSFTIMYAVPSSAWYAMLKHGKSSSRISPAWPSTKNCQQSWHAITVCDISFKAFYWLFLRVDVFEDLFLIDCLPLYLYGWMDGLAPAQYAGSNVTVFWCSYGSILGFCMFEGLVSHLHTSLHSMSAFISVVPHP